MGAAREDAAWAGCHARALVARGLRLLELRRRNQSGAAAVGGWCDQVGVRGVGVGAAAYPVARGVGEAEMMESSSMLARKSVLSIRPW